MIRNNMAAVRDSKELKVTWDHDGESYEVSFTAVLEGEGDTFTIDLLDGQYGEVDDLEQASRGADLFSIHVGGRPTGR